MSTQYQWSLKQLYESFEDPRLEQDFKQFLNLIADFSKFGMADFYANATAQEVVETYINCENQLGEYVSKISSFAHLSQATDAKNNQAQQWTDRIRQNSTKLTEPRVAFIYWLKENSDQLETLCGASELIKAHRFALQERIEESLHLLSREEESLISSMVQTGSTAWEGLQNKVTSLTMIPIELDGETKELPLSAIRNLAFHKDSDVRKKAFEAELGAYPKFIDVSAAALNAIKGEVITLADKKGYDSPLHMSLEASRMDETILNALIGAMEEALPIFRKYLKGKAKALGHEGGLPFYDIFAPLGSSSRQLTIETCKEIVETSFRSFSTELGEFAKQAFDHNWVDFEPRQGKRGGAFCANIYGIKESRFLCNYQGSMNNIITVAHELGHGFHGHNVFQESLLNAGYPMPLAETASTFCETIVKNKLMSQATEEEQLMLIETSIQGYNQIIVDIYSRFLFEKAIFDKRKNSSLAPEEFCALMADCQKQAYGDGIDENTLHPYMWMNKVHYYYASRNYYNFPYAFGLLFAMGLYAKSEQEGPAFAKRYNDMLRLTGKASIKEVGEFMGIDLADIAFWKGSLSIMERDIEKFLSLI